MNRKVKRNVPCHRCGANMPLAYPSFGGHYICTGCTGRAKMPNTIGGPSLCPQADKSEGVGGWDNVVRASEES